MKYPGDRVHLKNLSLPQLEAFVISLGEKPFRARQLAQWLYGRGARSFAEMTNLAGTFRNMLEEKAWISFLEPAKCKRPGTGRRNIAFSWMTGKRSKASCFRKKTTIRFAFPPRSAAPWVVRFCLTGKRGFVRNLIPRRS